jgi:hypothetical protein
VFFVRLRRTKKNTLSPNLLRRYKNYTFIGNCAANKKGRRVFVIFWVRSTQKITKTLPFFWLAEQLPLLML